VGRFVLAALVVVVAAVVAVVVERRRPDPPTQGPPSATWPAPTQLDRADFGRPDAPWLVAVFTSGTCQSCAEALTRAEVLRSEAVAVEEAEYTARGDLHGRFRIEAVPTIVVADAEGVVQASFVGPPSAADLWAAVAGARDQQD
jgi:protein-disulfide isomerase